MISQTAEYALRAVVWLASRPERPHGTAQIAGAVQVPAGYMAKVLQKLARAGLVASLPGRGGGVRLTRPAEGISVLDVVDAIDPVKRIRRCPLGLTGHEKLCPMHRQLDEAAARVQDVFARTRIVDLLADQMGAVPFCDSK